MVLIVTWFEMGCVVWIVMCVLVGGILYWLFRCLFVLVVVGRAG